MDYSGDKSTSPIEDIQRIVRQEFLNLGVAIPAIVDSFDPATQMIEATPMIRKRLRARDGSYSVEDRLKRIKIPMGAPYVRQLGFSLTMPISPGDQVIFLVQDRGIDLWQETGEISDPPDTHDTRGHQYTDVIYILNPIDLAGPIEDYQIDCAELRNRLRDTAVTIWDGEAQVRATPTNRTTWTAGGSVKTFAPINVEESALLDIKHDAGVDIDNNAGANMSNYALLKNTVEGGVEVEINGGIVDINSVGALTANGTTITITGTGAVQITGAPSITLTAPTVNVVGNLVVTGTVTAAGFSGPSSGAANFTNGLTTDSAVVDGVEVDGHTHEESGGGQTGPME